MRKISLDPEQLRVDTFHVDAGRDEAAGTVHGHREAEGKDLFSTMTRPNSQCPVNTCANTCATYVCFC